MDYFIKYSEELKLDNEKLKEDVKSGAIADKVQRDVAEGTGVGVNSTPTFFVNGLQLRGVPQYADLQKLIETELKR